MLSYRTPLTVVIDLDLKQISQSSSLQHQDPAASRPILAVVAATGH